MFSKIIVSTHFDDTTKRSIIYDNHCRADEYTCYFISPSLCLKGGLYNCFIIVINDENQFTGDKP